MFHKYILFSNKCVIDKITEETNNRCELNAYQFLLDDIYPIARKLLNIKIFEETKW